MLLTENLPAVTAANACGRSAAHAGSTHARIAHTGVACRATHARGASCAFRTAHASGLSKVRPVRLLHGLLLVNLAEMAKRRLLSGLGNVNSVLDVGNCLRRNFAKQAIQHFEMLAGGRLNAIVGLFLL